MPEHDCRFEADIAVLKNDMKSVKASVEAFGATTQRIYIILTGNGKEGLTAKVSKNSDNIIELKDAQTWWRRLIIGTTITGILGGLLAFCWYSLR